MATANDIDFRAGKANIYAPPGDDVTFTVLVRGMGYATAPTVSECVVGVQTPTTTVTLDLGTDIVAVRVSLTAIQTDALGTSPAPWHLQLEGGGRKKTFVGGTYHGDPTRPSSNNAVIAVTAADGTVNVAVVAGGGVVTGTGILAELAAVDGAGSGLDADLLDGQQGAAYQLVATKGQANGYASLDAGGTVPDAQIPATVARDAEVVAGDAALQAALDAHTIDTTAVHGIPDTSALLDTGDIGTTVQGHSAVLAATTASFTTADETKLAGIEAGATADMSSAEILAALLTVDGAGSGLDADLLDGMSSVAFQRKIWRNVVEAGADPTGVIDATTIIQGEIDTVAAAGGGVVWFPIGTYLISAELQVPQFVLLLGAGSGWENYGIVAAATTLKLADSSGLLASQGVVRFVYNGAFGDRRHFGGMHRIAVNGNKATNSSNGVVVEGVRFCYPTECSFIRCGNDGMRSVSHSGSGTSSNEVYLNRSFAGWNNGHGFNLSGGDSVIIGAMAGVNGLDGFRIVFSGSTFTGCSSWNNQRDGMSVSGSTTGGNIITGCSSYDNDRAGLTIESAVVALAVTGCAMRGNGRNAATYPDATHRSGIRVVGTPANVSVVGNLLASSNPDTYQQYGISFSDATAVIDAVGNTGAPAVAMTNQPGCMRSRVSAVTTAQRPSASSAGAGASHFDTTLGRPIWSDGTDWNAATGVLRNAYTIAETGATWTKPVWAKTITMRLRGGGGGGGSGRRGAAGTTRVGGGGGAGGAYTEIVLSASQVPDTLTVTVGAGGSGGAAVATDTTSGNAGGTGGNSSLVGGTFVLAARSGQGGAGGTSTSGTGGTGWITGTGTNASGSGSTGGTGGYGIFNGPGGGAGGGISSADVPNAGGNGTQVVNFSTATAASGGAINTNGSDGVAPGSANADAVWSAFSGGGGGASITGAAGSAGTSTGYGAGGSGGGASLNGFDSGAGGAGTPGFVEIISEG